MPTILIVDDEVRLREVVAVALENMGYATICASSAEEALELLERHEPNLILSDLRLPGMNGKELLEKAKHAAPGVPLVIMTAYASLHDAVQLIKDGAFDYMVKPFELDALEAVVASALRFHALGDENTRLRSALEREIAGTELVGQSQAFQAVRRHIAEVSDSLANVLITGESGTGKELVARAIHAASPRASGPFVPINCAAIPEALLESELFGHVKGAFTGATSNRIGRFRQADKGTIFLDEIGDMPLALQAKILRCIQERVVEPVGSATSHKVDVRIISATNQNLEQAIARNTFRQDLFYRLNVYPIFIPPLRERREDIGLLAEYFARRFCREMGKQPVVFLPESVEALKRHNWPGNIRELENCVERLSIIQGGKTVTPDMLPIPVSDGPGGDADGPQHQSTPGQTGPAGEPGFGMAAGLRLPLDLDAYLEQVEREIILQALERTEGVQVKAAQLLAISERSIWHRIKKLDIVMGKKSWS